MRADRPRMRPSLKEAVGVNAMVVRRLRGVHLLAWQTRAMRDTGLSPARAASPDSHVSTNF